MAEKTVKRKKTGTRKNGGLTNSTLLEWVRQWVTVKGERESLESREKEMKERLKEAVQTYGYTDDKGHTYLDLPEPVDDYVRLQRQRRVQQSIDEESALSLIRKHGLQDRCITYQPVIDQDELRKAVFTGDITEEEFDALIEEKENFAFVALKS